MAQQRVGLLLPSSNTTMETDFWRMAPEDVTVHSARMMIERVTVSALEEMSRLAPNFSVENLRLYLPAALVDRYQARLALYRSLYLALRPHFTELT